MDFLKTLGNMGGGIMDWASSPMGQQMLATLGAGFLTASGPSNQSPEQRLAPFVASMPQQLWQAKAYQAALQQAQLEKEREANLMSALSGLAQGSGAQFDPRIASLFGLASKDPSLAKSMIGPMTQSIMQGQQPKALKPKQRNLGTKVQSGFFDPTTGQETWNEPVPIEPKPDPWSKYREEQLGLSREKFEHDKQQDIRKLDTKAISKDYMDKTARRYMKGRMRELYSQEGELPKDIPTHIQKQILGLKEDELSPYEGFVRDINLNISKLPTPDPLTGIPTFDLGGEQKAIDTSNGELMDVPPDYDEAKRLLEALEADDRKAKKFKQAFKKGERNLQTSNGFIYRWNPTLKRIELISQ